MGAGKSTVGREVAKRLGLQFYDSDKAVEQKVGVSVATVFEREGESGFRIHEEEVIRELCQLEGIVLATGGGAVLSKNTRDLLLKTGRVFYLSASVDTLFDRTVGDSGRPLLEASNRQQTIIELLRQREPIYQKVAHHVIITDHRATDWVVDQVLKITERACAQEITLSNDHV